MIKKFKKVVKREGFFGLIYLVYLRLRIKQKIIQLFFIPISFPIAILILAISPWIKIRLIRLASNRVGHYPIDTEVLLSVMEKSAIEQEQYRTYFYNIAGYPICNQQIYFMLKRVITILPFPRLAAEVDNFLELLSLRYRCDQIRNFALSGDCRDRWNLIENSKRPHICFTQEELVKGKKILQEMGIKSNSPFVCLLMRDSLYLDKHMPKNNWSYHDYRDVSVENYKKAALFLAEKGYYVLRMGKVVRDRFIVTHNNVIDYANSAFRSDFMDVYLSAHCNFFISTSTGIDAIAKIFKRPLVITDAPLSDLDIWLHRNLFIPKKVLNLDTGRYLTNSENFQIFHETAAKKTVVKTAKEKNLQFVDNSPEEIKEVVEEMEARLTGNWVEAENDNHLQKQFWHGFQQDFSGPFVRLNIQEYKGENIYLKMKVGTMFLKNNLFLLEKSSIASSNSMNSETALP